MEGPLPVSQRAHALLHGRPRQGPLPLLRLRSGRRRHPLRPADRPARVSRGGRGSRRRASASRSRGASGAARARTGATGSTRRSPRHSASTRERLGRPGNAAAKYLEKRGVPEPSCGRTLALGHAPDAWDSLGKALTAGVPGGPAHRGGSPAAARRRQGRLRPFPRPAALRRAGRAGRPVGLRRPRAVPRGRAQVPQLPRVAGLLQEAPALRPLFEAREAIRRRDRVVLVEGYFDHLALVRAGVAETVASMGTALTPEQAERLRRLTSARDRLLRRRLGGPKRHPRRARAPPGPGLPGPCREAARGRGPGRPAAARGARSAGAANRRGPGLPDLASRGRAPAGEPASRRPRSGSGWARSSRSSTPSPTGSSATRSTASSPRPLPCRSRSSGEATKRTCRLRMSRSIGVGTPGNSGRRYPQWTAPAAERRLLRA